MHKKGVSISINMVIIAVIALLVLAIVIFLLSGGVSNFKSGTACAVKGGVCVDSGSSTACMTSERISDSTNTNNPTLCGKGSGKVCCPIAS